jgi:sulfatase modifying factor 1
MMGSPEGEHGRRNDEHQHKVTISKAFYMQTTEVTQGQWWDIMRTQPWRGERLSDHVKEGVNYPATYVSWKDAVAYCKLLSEYSTKVHRLPTEAEWEYACRAGTTTAYSFGDDAIRLSEYAWHELNSNAIEGPKYYNHQVGLKKSNAFGLYDMYGNVHEWCSDYYGEDYYKQSPATDPTGPASGVKCVFRGGSLWHGAMDSRGAVHYSPVACRSASRVSRNVRQRAEASGHERHLNFGFRIVRELD